MRTAAPVLHFHVERGALCLEPDCRHVFQLGSDTCPACGSTSWVNLARWLR